MGTIQGLILGPIRYTFFIRPLYKITKITTFINDNYVVKYKKIKNCSRRTWNGTKKNG